MKNCVSKLAVLLLTVSFCFANGCAPRSAQTAEKVLSFSQGTEVTDKTEDGIHIQTAIPVFSGFSSAKQLNEKIRGISDDGIADIKQAAQELGENAVPDTLFYESYFDSFLDNDLLSVWVTNENYTGGAHGSRWIKSFTVNIQTGEFYNTPGSLFKDPAAGTKLITDKIIKDIQKQPDAYFPEAIQTVQSKEGNYSFYLDGQNLVVYFDLYELVPYAGGMPVFTFPLADLQTNLRLGNNPAMGEVRSNGMNIAFEHRVISDEKGVWLPLKDTANALCHTVEENNGKYTVDGRPVLPVMMNGAAYMPIPYFTDLEKEFAIKGFAVYDGKVLRMFTQTARSLEEENLLGGASSNGTNKETPVSSINSSSADENTEEILAYIKNFDSAGGQVTYDPIEWVTAQDTKRMKELGLKKEDMPNGFHIYNPSKETENLKLSPNAAFDIVYWNNEMVENGHMAVSREKFAQRLNQEHASEFPFHLTVKDDVITKVQEQYVP